MKPSYIEQHEQPTEQIVLTARNNILNKVNDPFTYVHADAD